MITYFNTLAFVISLTNFNIALFEQYWQNCQNYVTEKNSNDYMTSIHAALGFVTIQ